MKKKLSIILTIAILIMFTGISIAFLCYKNSTSNITNIELSLNYNEWISDETILKKGHVNLLSKYASESSFGFENIDGTNTIYVFASPIQFQENGSYVLIDNRICNTGKLEKDNGYAYTVARNNIVSLYPHEMSKEKGFLIKDLFEYEVGTLNATNAYAKYENRRNIIGKTVPMLTYENVLGPNTDIHLYPSSVGTNCEITFKKKSSNKLSFWLKINDPLVLIEENGGGYLTMVKKITDSVGNVTSKILGMIQLPFIKNSNNDISLSNSMEIVETNDDAVRIEMSFDEAFIDSGSTAFLSFEMRREKQPDNAIYSGQPYLKGSYLSNCYAIGNHPTKGIGRALIRYQNIQKFAVIPERIKNVSYYMYNLSSQYGDFCMKPVLDDWCSITGNWQNQYRTGDISTILHGVPGENIVNITNESKRWCADTSGQLERQGLTFQSLEDKNGQWWPFLSNDNTLYPIKTEITTYPYE